MPLSCSDLRRTLRHPEEHPRHAVSLGRWTGVLVTTSFLNEGMAEADILEVYREPHAEYLPELDPSIAGLQAGWCELFQACVIREEVRRRLGSKGVIGFDTASEGIQKGLTFLVEKGMKLKRPPPEQLLTFWYHHFEAVLSQLLELRPLDLTPKMMTEGLTVPIMRAVTRAEAFADVVLREDPASPLYQDGENPRLEELRTQVSQNLAYVEEVAAGLGWFFIKDAIRQAMSNDGDFAGPPGLEFPEG